MLWHAVKRWLYLTHRWIGIATCLLFVLWFASGLVMLHVPFPELTDKERLAGSSQIVWDQVRSEPAAAQDVRELALEMRGDRPIWRISPWQAEPYSVWADTGRTAGRADEVEARKIAAAFGHASVKRIRLIHNDQWTVPGGYDTDRPLWKAELAGPAGRVLYVSSASGAVVLDTARRERMWNWVGSIPHWLYPRALREDQPLWRQVVMWVSGPCILGALTGIWIGLLRIRPGRHRFKGGRMTPYRGWMKWHHLSGLIGSVFLVLWIFSGWLSVDPFRLFASEGPGLAEHRAYAGIPSVDAPPLSILANISGPDARRVTITAAAGREVIRAQSSEQKDILLDGNSFAPFKPPLALLVQSARALVPDARVQATSLLRASDAYWYAVHGEVPLPVLRVKFADRSATWIHIDPASGKVLGAGDARRRTYRWLFDLFHRWDLNLLLSSRPAREILIWLMSLAGLVSSVSAVWIGWRRLRRRAT